MAEWPKVAPKPEPGDYVQVAMPERMARIFEERCLGRHTRGLTELSPPMLFSADDLPTYIISIVDGDQT